MAKATQDQGMTSQMWNLTIVVNFTIVAKATQDQGMTLYWRLAWLMKEEKTINGT